MASTLAEPSVGDRLTERRYIRPFRTIANRRLRRRREECIAGRDVSQSDVARDSRAERFRHIRRAYRDVLSDAQAVAAAARRVRRLEPANAPISASRRARTPDRRQGGDSASVGRRDRCSVSRARPRVRQRPQRCRSQLGDRRRPTQRPALPASTKVSQRARRTKCCSKRIAAVWPAFFLERAIHYRIDQGFDHFKVALSSAS